MQNKTINVLIILTILTGLLSCGDKFIRFMNTSTTLFANAGISQNNIQSLSDEKLTGYSTQFGILANAGINLKIKQNLGVTMGLGFNKECKMQKNA